MMWFDLLAFFVRTPVITDRDFIKYFSALGCAAKDFGMLLPTFRKQFFGTDQIAPVAKIAAVDVGKGRVE